MTASPTSPRGAGAPAAGTPRRLLGVTAAVVLFAIAFAYVESAVVIGLRELYDPLRASLYPDRPPGELFPLITAEQLRTAGPAHMRHLAIELGRELATLVMLATVAAAAARSLGQWFAWFMIAFGVWDIFYYVWLAVCIGWPTSLGQWDILFLLPVVWAGPVIAPIVVSLAMISAGGVILGCEARGVAWRPGRRASAGILLGALIVIVAFCWDSRRLMAGHLPRAFPTWLFTLGLAVGAAFFAMGLRRSAGKRA